MKRILFVLFLTLASLRMAGAIEIADHPRLIMKAGEERLIMDKLNDPGREYMLATHCLIMDYAAISMSLPCMERTDTDGHILARVREVEKRVTCLAYAYRVTGNEIWAERAEKEMLNLCSYRDWDPAHYLDTAEAIIALSFGYDWLYDYLSEASRETIRDAVLHKGLQTAEGQAFYDVIHNWNQVCNAAMVIGSLAFYESFPEQARAFIEKSLRSNPKAMAVYAPDGAYPEGNTYWGFGTSYEILMIESLMTAAGSDFGISKAEGFMNTGNYIKYLATPSGNCYSFYDSNTAQLAHLMTFWFARELKDPTLCHLEKQMLSSGKVKTPDRWWPCAMLFLSQVELEDAGFKPDNILFVRGINPIWVYRSGWDSSDDTYLAVKGGKPDNNHGHMDNGSFYLEKYRTIWAADLGFQSYGTFYKYGVELGDRRRDGGDRWSIYRAGPSAHNVLMTGDVNPDPEGFAEIVSTWDDAGGKGCRVDLCQTYAPLLTSAFRDVSASPDDRVITVMDRMVPSSDTLDVVWNMITYGVPTIVSDSGILLTSGGHAMMLEAQCDIPVRAFILPAGKDTKWDAKNPGVSRVGFSLKPQQNRETVLTVTITDRQ